ncbi:MAG: tetratricopeptide repeat protein [Melioribacteraceae bacterium]|nr:tetratricopeptide repeat protein [Melioribacteraceae bacterium]
MKLNSKIKKSGMFSNLEKSEKKFLFVILLTALALRVYYVFEVFNTPFLKHLFSDPAIYSQWAKDLVANGFIGDSVFFMAPLYPYTLAVFYSLFGESNLPVLLFQSLVSTFTILLIYLAARNSFSKFTAIAAAIIAVFYSQFIFYSGLVLSETLQIFFLTLLIYLLSKKDEFYLTDKWMMIGLFLGFSLLIRGNIILIFFGIVLWMISRRRSDKKFKSIFVKSLVNLTIGTASLVLFAAVHNYIIGNDFVLLTSNGGINFYIGNNEKAQGVFVTPTEFDYSSDMTGEKYAEQQTGSDLAPSEVSSYWYDKSFNYIFNNPGDEILLILKKFLLFWGENENSQSSVINYDYFKNHYSHLLQLPFFNWLFISSLAVFGLFFYRKNREHNGLYYVVLAMYVFATIIFFVNGRYRLGITPLVIIFAAFGIEQLIASLKDLNFSAIKIPITILMSFFIVYYLILDKPEFTEYDAYLYLGDIAFEEKNYDEAIEQYNRSLFFRDYYMTYMNIGNAFALKKDFRNAISSFTKAINRNPADVKAHFNLGFAYTQIGEFEHALNSYQRAIELDPTFAGAYRNSGIIHYVSENYEEALYYFEKFLSLSDDEEINASVRYDIDKIKTEFLHKETNK